MNQRQLDELEAWMESLNPPSFPTVAEIELMDFLYDVALLEQSIRSGNGVPPEGGTVIDLFCTAGANP